MKKTMSMMFVGSLLFTLLTSEGCDDTRPANTSALDEQSHTETNQQRLLANQPLPNISWSMERDNLIRLKKLQNDRSVDFFMYVFIEGVGEPIGYYQVNKVSSVNSQLSNPQQIIFSGQSFNNIPSGEPCVVESPSEDGSYGSNGDAVFGFTPEGICIETNMKFITATVPLNFPKQVNRLAVITTDEAKALLERSQKVMSK